MAKKAKQDQTMQQAANPNPNPAAAKQEENPELAAALGNAFPQGNLNPPAKPQMPGRDWKAEGAQAGKDVAETLNKAEGYVKERLLEAAAEIASVPETVELWLSGYAVHQPPSRVSEAKAVFRACSVVAWTRVEGMNEDKSPKRVTKSGHAWLSEFQGTYHNMVTFARQIAPITSGKGSGGGPKTVKALSDKGVVKVMDSIKKATPTQALSVAQKAVSQVAAMPSFEIPLFRMARGPLQSIVAATKDEKMKKTAFDCLLQIDELLEAAEKASKELAQKVA